MVSGGIRKDALGEIQERFPRWIPLRIAGEIPKKKTFGGITVGIRGGVLEEFVKVFSIPAETSEEVLEQNEKNPWWNSWQNIGMNSWSNLGKNFGRNSERKILEESQKELWEELGRKKKLLGHLRRKSWRYQGRNYGRNPCRKPWRNPQNLTGRNPQKEELFEEFVSLGVPSKTPPGVLSEILPGVPSDILLGFLLWSITELSPWDLTVIFPGVSSGISPWVFFGFPAGFSSKMPARIPYRFPSKISSKIFLQKFQNFLLRFFRILSWDSISKFFRNSFYDLPRNSFSVSCRSSF